MRCREGGGSKLMFVMLLKMWGRGEIAGKWE